MGGCGCLASTNVLEDRGDNIGIFDAGDDARFAPRLGRVSMSMAKTRFGRCV